MQVEKNVNEDEIDAMFDDEIIAQVKTPIKLNTIKKTADSSDDILTESDLKKYYDKNFPYAEYFKWYGAADPSFFSKREFSFTKKGDIYIRFLSFRNDIELKEAMIKETPIKIDIGAVYNTPPKFRSTNSSNTTFIPVEKELVFDIDMTDYDDVRTCCSEAKMCNKCWKYLLVAYKILNAALTTDFGFKQIMWVFSGRRGVHCWVGDDRARKLNNDGRSAIINYLKWKTINKNTGLTFLMKEPLHPSTVRALKIIQQSFVEDALKAQDILNKSDVLDIVKVVLKAYLGSKKEYSSYEIKINEILNSKSNSLKKWDELVTLLQIFDDNKEKRATMAFKEIKMAIFYPRLDINVSKHINHLLKSPFCVHPKTGMISVPMDDYFMENFDLEQIPTLSETLLDNFNNVKNGKFDRFVKIFKKCIEAFDYNEEKNN